MSKHAGASKSENFVAELQGFNDEPFKELDRALKRLEEMVGDKTTEDKWSELEYDKDELFHECRKFLEQSRRFLKGAAYYEEPNAYEVGEIALDDFKQMANVLTLLYPEETENLGSQESASLPGDEEEIKYRLNMKEMVQSVGDVKKSVYRNMDAETVSIPYREYKKVKLSLKEFDSENPYCVGS